MNVIRVVEILLGYALTIGLVWAFIESSRFTSAQYQGARKLGRTPWLIALGAAIVVNFWLGGFRFSDPIGGRSLTWIAALLVLVVYLYDLRPRLIAQRMSGV